MLGGLFKRLTAIAVVAGCALVVVVAAGATLYFALRLVLVGWGAAAVTALVFAAIAAVTVTAFLGKAQGRDAGDDDDVDDEDDGGLAHRVVGVIKNRPIIGVVAALAGGMILLRNPALATIAATAFGAGGRKRRGRRGR